MKSVEIYTDGACSGNPGPGGWAAVLKFKGIEKEISGHDAMTTNNRMEMTAVIRSLEALNQPCAVVLFTDSSYVSNAYNNGWLKSWIAKGWKNSAGKPVENRDLWEQMIRLTKTHTVRFVKVKGHADNEYNNRCDKLARAAIKSFLSESDGSSGRQNEIDDPGMESR